MAIVPVWPSRRSISAAAWPAAPVPTISTAGDEAGDRRRARLLAPADLHPIARADDVVAGQGIERRRPHRLTGAQVEAGVVPGAAHAVPVDRALGQRAAVVAAGCADGEDLVALAHDQHGVVARVADDRFSVHELGERDARGQIWSTWLSLVSAHGR